jgi:LPXTG-motif cell wall-anchored protein
MKTYVRDLKVNHDQVSMISRIIIAGIAAGAIVFATNGNQVKADTTSDTPATTQPASSTAGTTPVETYITTGEGIRPVINHNGRDYIVEPSGQLIEEAGTYPTWGLMLTSEDSINQSNAEIIKDQKAEAALNDSSATSAAASGTKNAQSSSASATSATPKVTATSHTAAAIPKKTVSASSAPATTAKAFPQTGNNQNIGLTIMGAVVAGLAAVITFIKVTTKKII